MIRRPACAPVRGARAGRGLRACGLALAAAGWVVAAGAGAPALPETCYLFSYFTGNGEDGLHLAWSRDGFAWEALRGGASFLKPEVGESKLMRDPCLLRGPDGAFHMVWTTSWKGSTIGYASSKDLVNWSPQQAIPVMKHEPTVLNCWAPEIAWNAGEKRFVIFWASTIPGRFPATEGKGDGKNNHRIYATTTRDFTNFTPTRLFYDGGFNVIDATPVQDGGRTLLIVKDETKDPVRKNLRIAEGPGIEGPFGPASAPFTRDWVEGPSAMRVGDAWIVYFDCYRDRHYGALRSRDLKTWEDVTPQLRFPAGVRHGTALAVPAAVLSPLLTATP